MLMILLASAGFAGDTGATGQEAVRVGENPQARQQWFLRGRRTANGKSPAEMLSRAWGQREAIRKAQAQRTQKRQSTTQTASATAASNTSSLLSASWTSLGPSPITGMDPGTTNYQDATGRVTAVAVDPNDTTGNTVYAAGAYGGVWKSTNAATTSALANGNPAVTWTALFDTAAPTLSIGAVAVQPGAPTASSRVVLAGTGEPNSAIDSYYGLGILRSADGGATWNTGGIISQTVDASPTSFQGIGFSKFAFSTANNQAVVAGGAVTPIGNQFNLTSLSGGHSGIYYSGDAGAHWRTAAATDSGTQIQWARVTDVVYSAKFDRFFAFIAFHGVYESTDNTASNWTRLASQPSPANLTTANCPANPLNTNCKAYRGELAVRSVTGDLYTLFEDGNDNNMGVWKAVFDGSGNVTSWTQFGTAGIDTCGDNSGCGLQQGFYNLALAAVPNGSNTDLYAGAVNLFKCTVSGTNPTCSNSGSWLNLTHEYPNSGSTCLTSTTYRTMHVDFHGISWNLTGGSAEGTVMFLGNDGGVYRTLNSFAMNNGACDSTGNPWDNLNDTLGSLTQFIAVTNHPTNAAVVMGGTQDNGTPAMSTSDGQTSGKQWYEAWGGDGGFGAIDPAATATSGLWYTTWTDVSIFSCNSGGQCITGAPFSPDIYNKATADSSPSFLKSPNFPDRGAFYTPWILDPQDATKVIIGTCRVWRGPANSPASWGLTSFTNALSNKLIDMTSTTACSGTPATNDDVDKEAVSAVAAGGPKNSSGSSVIWVGTASVTGGGKADVYVNTNATTGIGTWSDVGTAANINPNQFPVASIAVDRTDSTGKTAYAAIQGFMGNSTGAGHLWKTTNAGASWTDVGLGLPDAPANAIVIDPASNLTLYVGTDVGVYVSQDGGATWGLYGSGLPNVAVFDLKAFSSGGTTMLRAATHGRGVWEAPLAGGVTPPPATADFALAVSGSDTATVTAGQAASYTIGVTSVNGTFSSAVSLACSGLPSKASCTFSPASVTPGASGATSTLTISTTAATTAMNGQRRAPIYAFLLPIPLGLALLARRRKPLLCLGMTLGVTLLLGMAACGGGANTANTNPVPVPGTPAGTYSITVTGTSGTTTHSTTVSLTVK